MPMAPSERLLLAEAGACTSITGIVRAGDYIEDSEGPANAGAASASATALATALASAAAAAPVPCAVRRWVELVAERNPRRKMPPRKAERIMSANRPQLITLQGSMKSARSSR